jgi:hypothetical protein
LMFEAPIPRLETRDFTIGIAAVDDLGAGAEKLRQSVAEKSLSARAHAKRSDLIGARDEGLRRTTRLLACSRDDRGCAGGERMHFLKRHDRVAVMVRASDQRMFRRSGDRFADKNMRHSLATRIAGSDSCQCVPEIGNVALCRNDSF